MVNKFCEFTLSSDLYKSDNKGNEHLVKTGVLSKITMNIRDILSVSEAVNKKGKVMKTKCLIYHNEMGRILLSQKYNDVKRIQDNYLKNNSRVKVRGFL